MGKEYKFLVFKGNTIALTKNEDGFWVDDFGTVYAFRDASTSIDSRDVCGVGVLSLSRDDPRNAACKVHDFMYESPVYQAFHYREEADAYLRKLLEQVPGYEGALTPDLFYWISRTVGGVFWEFDKTND